MAKPDPDDLAALSPAELLELVRELRAANEQLRAGFFPLPAIQGGLDDQLRRTSLLSQLAIEFRESLDPATVVEQTLKAVAASLVVAGASIILVGQGTAVELATTIGAGEARPMDRAVAASVIERGLAGWALRHGSSVALSDVARDRRWLQFSEHHRTGSVIVIPIRHSAATLGVLTVHRLMPNAFSSHDLILLEGVAAQLGVALSAARHQANERQRRNQAMALLSMSQFLTAECTPAELAATLQEKSIKVFGAQAGLLFLGDASGELRPILPAGELAPDQGVVASAVGAARLAWAGRSIATTGPTPDSTCVALPLVSRGVAIGAYALIHANNGGPSASVWSLLTVFAHVVAAACANMRLVARLTAQAHTLESMVAQRTRQVQHSRDALRAVFDSLGEGILLIDAEERILAANSHFCRHLAGLHPREVAGRSYAQIWQQIEHRGPLQVTLIATPESGGQRLAVRQQVAGEARQFLVERTAIGARGRPSEQFIELWREEKP